MGISVGFSRSTYDRIDPYDYGGDIRANVGTKPNPNPANYIIQNYWVVGDNLVLKIKYLDCTTYEGTKILVYKNIDLDQLRKQGCIDPHFSDNAKYISPFARFVPTSDGIDAALELAKLL